jgi:hypothetical protein
MTGKIRSTDNKRSKPPGGPPTNRPQPVVFSAVSKHAKAKQPKPKK